MLMIETIKFVMKSQMYNGESLLWQTEVLKQMSCNGRLVVATGGGIVIRPVNW